MSFPLSLALLVYEAFSCLEGSKDNVGIRFALLVSLPAVLPPFQETVAVCHIISAYGRALGALLLALLFRQLSPGGGERLWGREGGL